MDTSSSKHGSCVDDSNFSALSDDEEVFPISDEKYAHELQLQEVLMSSSSSSSGNRHHYEVEHREVMSDAKRKGIEIGEPSASQPSLDSCMICMEPKFSAEMFRTRTCSHSFCIDCTTKYTSVKIQDNITNVKCPDLSRRGTLDHVTCGKIIPQEVFDRWEQALCESAFLGLNRVYCPYKDCSAFMVDDILTGGETVTSSECPICHRLCSVLSVALLGIPG